MSEQTGRLADVEPKRRGTRLHPLGLEQLTVSAGAGGLLEIPAAEGRGDIYALIEVESQSVRYRDDGVDPTTSVGTLLEEGDILDYDGDVEALVFIRASENDAALNVSYYS